MKILTITCHEVYNHGASLQEYALLYYLNSLGHNAEAVHYKPPYLSGHFSLWTVSNPKYKKPLIKQLYLLAKLPVRLKDLPRKNAFDAFAKMNIPTDKTLYVSNEELKANLPQADAYICGSDQIWNSFFKNGKDPAFYLDFVPENCLKISYAASFAIDELHEEIKPFVKEKVDLLDNISVRETSGVRLLNDLGVKDVTQVLDPVFLLDASHWERFIEPINEKYIFIYDFDSNPLIKKIALELKKEKKCKIFTVNKNINYADKNYYLEGPENYLSLMYHADFVLTNSFHSVAFSLIFEKQFIVVNRKDKINTRMRDLLSLFDLNNLIGKYSEFQMVKENDYEIINPRIEKEITKSRFFLIESLK